VRVDLLDATSKDPLRSDLNKKIHIIQGLIIRNKIPELFAKIASWIPDPSSNSPYETKRIVTVACLPSGSRSCVCVATCCIT